ncbi:glutamyl-tRNA amidotransferase [Ruminococcaceae bacterium OttesenSCG-928-D13]|nr:glutamyl-tRNA amidotransferase [Ruminococcaceae bacterium OttesenSCG-928-D13]
MKEKLDAMFERMKTERERPRTLEEKESRVVHGYLGTCLAVILLVFGAVPAHAAGGDPIATINNLSTFIFSAIRAIGIIILGFGVVQIGLSLKSHDASQRANGFLTFFGGVVITFAKNILDLVVGT